MSKGVNRVILISAYVRGASISVIAKRYGLALSTVRVWLKNAGVLRSRTEGVRLAAKQGKLGSGIRGKNRYFTDEHRAAMQRSALARWERDSVGVSLKPSGYLEITRGKHKGKSQHRMIVEELLCRKLCHDEVVHHVDHNKLNNDPSNLRVMSRSEHTALHRKESRHEGC